MGRPKKQPVDTTGTGWFYSSVGILAGGLRVRPGQTFQGDIGRFSGVSGVTRVDGPPPDPADPDENLEADIAAMLAATEQEETDGVGSVGADNPDSGTPIETG